MIFFDILELCGIFYVTFKQNVELQKLYGNFKVCRNVVALTLEMLGRKLEFATVICAFQSEREDICRWQQTSEPNLVQRKFSVISKLMVTHKKCIVLKEPVSSQSRLPKPDASLLLELHVAP